MDGSSINRLDNDEKQSILETIAFIGSSTKIELNEIMQNVLLLKEVVANKSKNFNIVYLKIQYNIFNGKDGMELQFRLEFFM